MRPSGPATRYLDMTREKAEEIRRAYFAGRVTQTQIAERYGIRQGTVSRIVSGQVWQ
jgi:DNA-binding transcriptional regulator LsrR (DeoR family)